MMTLFSYLVSLAADKNFSEPEHLDTMIHRLAPGISKKQSQVVGWGYALCSRLIICTGVPGALANRKNTKEYT